MSKEAFERKLAQVEALRSAPDSEAVPALRKALKDRSNYVVSKAVAIVAARRRQDLVPDLLDAFERGLRDPVKTDPQCWAKNAIVKALKDLDHTDPAVFLRGIAHIQMEPSYLRAEDTAVTLRGACAMALLACSIDSFDLLTRLTDLLCDLETPARIDAARAIGQLSAREGALPLRLKARLGDEEPEVIGHCLAALLNLNVTENLPFVGEFLRNDNPDLRMEAAGVLAEARSPEALALLTGFFERQTDPEIKRALVTFIAASPQPEAAEYLLSALESASEKLAAQIATALAGSRYAAACNDRIAVIMAGRQR